MDFFSTWPRGEYKCVKRYEIRVAFKSLKSQVDAVKAAAAQVSAERAQEDYTSVLLHKRTFKNSSRLEIIPGIFF